MAHAYDPNGTKNSSDATKMTKIKSSSLQRCSTPTIDWTGDEAVWTPKYLLKWCIGFDNV